MANIFDATSTADDVLSGVSLKGKRILVTGVSAGLGVETARALAARGAQVVGAARDLSKAGVATAQVRKDAATGGGKFELIALDLASLTSVRACADTLLAKEEQPPGTLCPGESDRSADPLGRAVGQSVFIRAPLRQCRSRGSKL
jgi:NAD(P)-dependent dehydrogenase (short-subunit alcohol dehydrogenase family)